MLVINEAEEARIIVVTTSGEYVRKWVLPSEIRGNVNPPGSESCASGPFNKRTDTKTFR
jgi:hypothetical protein